MSHALQTIDESKRTPQQHTGPCDDCPWRRTSLAGWLGAHSPEEWLADVRSRGRLDCHTLKKKKGEQWQCAGAAIFRANILMVPMPGQLKLPKSDQVFDKDAEFLAHHKSRPKPRAVKPRRMVTRVEPREYTEETEKVMDLIEHLGNPVAMSLDEYKEFLQDVGSALHMRLMAVHDDIKKRDL